MVIESVQPVVEDERSLLAAEEDVTVRVLRAVEGFGHDVRARERARTVGLSRVLVLVVALALLAGIVVTINDLIDDTVQGIEQGL